MIFVCVKEPSVHSSALFSTPLTTPSRTPESKLQAKFLPLFQNDQIV
jgi:hypothetical protein